MKKGRHLLATAVAAVIASITTTTSASRYEIPLPFSKIQNLYHFSSIVLPNQNLLHSSFISNSDIPGNFFSSPGLTSVSGNTSLSFNDGQFLTASGGNLSNSDIPGNFFSSPGLTSISGNTPLSFNDGQFLTASGVNLSNTDVAQLLYGTDLNTATINSAGSSGVIVSSGAIRDNLSGNSSVVGTFNLIGNAGTTNSFTSVGIIKIGSGGVIITGNNSVVPEPASLALFGAIGTAIVTKRPKRRVS